MARKICDFNHISPELSREQVDELIGYYKTTHQKWFLYTPEFLKTGLAKIRAHSTTWQLKAIKSVQRPIKSLYLTPSSNLMVPRSIPMSRSLE